MTDAKSQCLICDGSSFKCGHFLANFGITESDVGGGELYDHLGDIENLLIEAISVDDKVIKNHSFSILVEVIQSYASENEMEPQDAYSENRYLVVKALREHFEDHKDVLFEAYGVGEASGTYAYENCWSEDPKSVIGDLLSSLRH
mgnify:FL=1